jgi:hypothetical protein
VQRPSIIMSQKDSTESASPGNFRENPVIAIGSISDVFLAESPPCSDSEISEAEEDDKCGDEDIDADEEFGVVVMMIL